VSTALSIDKVTLPFQDHVLDSATTVPENAGADTSSANGKEDVEMKDLTTSEIQLADSKSGEGSVIANQEPEAELFLRGITDQLKWQELVSKWLAFEKDYPIKGVFSFFYSSFVLC
jgi:hypothetical protein